MSRVRTYLSRPALMLRGLEDPKPAYGQLRVFRTSKHSRVIALVITLCLCLCAAPCWSAPADDHGVTKRVLDNGLTVVIKPEKGSGLVAIVAAIRAGAGQESIQNAGIGNFVAQLLLAGTRLSSAEEVAGVADEVGGNIGALWRQDFSEIRTVTTSAQFNHAMNLIGECLTEANFEDKWVEQVRADLLKQLQTASDNTFQNAYADLRNLLYEDNGYRRPDLGFERVIRQATPQDLRKFYTAYYVPNNIVLSIAGDVTVEQALDRASKAFAGVLPGKLPLNRGVPDEKLDRNSFRASEVDLPAAYLMVGWLAPGMTSPDFPALAVAANALGGGKGSLMFRELRQKRGMGYDVGTLYPRTRYQSHVLAYVVTDPYKQVLPGLKGSLVLDEVKSALLEQIASLKDKPLSEQDLQRAKGYTIGAYALSQQHLLDRAFLLAWWEAVGMGSEAAYKFPKDVDKVTAEDIQRVARKYFGNHAAIVLMPRSKSPTADSKQ